MTRRSEKTTFAALIAVCALGALYPVATAVAHRTESSAHALKPGGVEADAVVTVLKTGVRIAPAQLQAGRATFYIVNKTGALQSVVIDGRRLENLADGNVVNHIQVPPHEAALAKVALDRMLAVS